MHLAQKGGNWLPPARPAGPVLRHLPGFGLDFWHRGGQDELVTAVGDYFLGSPVQSQTLLSYSHPHLGCGPHGQAQTRSLAGPHSWLIHSGATATQEGARLWDPSLAVCGVGGAVSVCVCLCGGRLLRHLRGLCVPVTDSVCGVVSMSLRRGFVTVSL